MSIALLSRFIKSASYVIENTGASYRDISLLNGCLIFGTIIFGALGGLILGWGAHQVVIGFTEILPKEPSPSFVPFYWPLVSQFLGTRYCDYSIFTFIVDSGHAGFAVILTHTYPLNGCSDY